MEKELKAKPKRSLLIRGLAALLPTILTVYIFYQLIYFVNDEFGKPINSVFKSMFKTESGKKTFIRIFKIKEEVAKDDTAFSKAVDKRFPNIVGLIVAFLLAIIVLFILGIFVASYIGNKIFVYIQQLLNRIPIIKIVYSAAEQITQFFFEPKQSFHENKAPVLVEYPRRGVYTLGLVTGEGFYSLYKKIGKKLVTVFIPTAPVPVAGFVIMVPADEVIMVPISVDDALKFIIAVGVVVPENEKLIPADSPDAQRIYGELKKPIEEKEKN